MKSTLALAFVVLIGASATSRADAPRAEGSWSVQVGPAYIYFNEKATLSAGGARVPGASLEVENSTTLVADITYHFTPNWAAGVTLGVPPTSDVTGAGTAQPFGKLGSVRYGPLVLVGKYSFNSDGAWRPYIGAGAVYYAILEENDGFINDLRVDNAFGVALQAGIRYDLTARIGLFLDFKKLFIETTANGNLPALGGAPVRADVTLDPAAFHLGAALRF